MVLYPIYAQVPLGTSYQFWSKDGSFLVNLSLGVRKSLFYCVEEQG